MKEKELTLSRGYPQPSDYTNLKVTIRNELVYDGIGSSFPDEIRKRLYGLNKSDYTCESEFDREGFDKHLKELHIEIENKRKDIKDLLEDKYNTKGHPKANLLFDLASSEQLFNDINDLDISDAIYTSDPSGYIKNLYCSIDYYYYMLLPLIQ